MGYTDKALELFSQKFHCSQAVLAAFSKDLGITEEQALKLGGCFGGDMCKGEVCGACTGALMALGLKYGQSEISDFGKKKEEKKICCIKVLGSGCASCHALYENAKEAVEKMGILVEVEYVTDLQKVMGYGVMSMPALVVNEKVVAMGKVLKPADVEKLLHKFGLT